MHPLLAVLAFSPRPLSNESPPLFRHWQQPMRTCCEIKGENEGQAVAHLNSSMLHREYFHLLYSSTSFSDILPHGSVRTSIGDDRSCREIDHNRAFHGSLLIKFRNPSTVRLCRTRTPSHHQPSLVGKHRFKRLKYHSPCEAAARL